VTPTHGSAPLRIGTRDFGSFFLGAIREVRLWNRALTATEVNGLFGGTAPQDGLVAEYCLAAMSRLTAWVCINGVCGRDVGGRVKCAFFIHYDFFVVHIARCAMFEPMAMQTPFAQVEIN